MKREALTLGAILKSVIYDLCPLINLSDGWTAAGARYRPPWISRVPAPPTFPKGNRKVPLCAFVDFQPFHLSES